MRVDYILATQPLARLAKQCYVSDHEDSEAASDHYPVVAEVDLDLVA